MPSPPDLKTAFKEYESVLNDTLLRVWDPIGVATEPAAQSEYESYIPQVFRLLADGASQDEVFSHLRQLETEHIGLRDNCERTREAAEALSEVGRRLRRDLNRSTFQSEVTATQSGQSGGPTEPDLTVNVDLSNARFDDFVRFWFEHTIDPRALGPHRSPEFAWYQNVEIRFEPLSYAENFIRLFKAPEFLVDKYSKDQLEEGFFAMMSPMVQGGLDALVWSAQLSLDARERLVGSMYELFARLFAREPLDSASYMWWDLLSDRMAEDQSRDGASLRQTMFEVLCRILNLDARSCQVAALHGLNHLEDPRTETVVKEWLARHPTLDQKLQTFAECCMVFMGP